MAWTTPRLLSVGMAFGLTIFAGLSHALPQPSVPDAATPGGAQPAQPALPPTVGDAKGELIDLPPPGNKPGGDAADGERILVKSFRLVEARDRPERGLRLAEIRARLDALVQARPEGFTLALLNEAADSVASWYRGKGFVLAQAYIPEQTVENGEVLIRVVEGRLDRVLSEGASLYREELLLSPFRGQLGGPVVKQDLESALLSVRDFPGLDLTGVLQPGPEPGGTDLVLKVRKERRFELVIGQDNYGTRFTGDQRIFLQAAANNPGGRADRLAIAVLRTLDPASTTWGSVSYRCPLGTPDWSLGLSWQRTKFSVGEAFNVLGVGSETEIADLSLDRALSRGRASSSYARLGLSRKEAATRTLAGASLGEDVLAVAALELGGEWRDDGLAGVNTAYVAWHQGFGSTLGSLLSEDDPRSSRRGASGRYAGGRFDKQVAGYSRLQRLGPSFALLLRASWQDSDDLLTSLEQLGIGGPRSVRAYPSSEFLLERGLSWSVEWIMRAPGAADEPAFDGFTWGDIYQVSLFADFARGGRLEPLVDRPGTVDLRGVGAGFQCGLPGRAIFQLTVAAPTISLEASNGRPIQTFFGMSWRF